MRTSQTLSRVFLVLLLSAAVLPGWWADAGAQALPPAAAPPLATVDKTPPAGTGDSGWRLTAGAATAGKDGSVALAARSCAVRQTPLTAGLYELTLETRGAGILTLAAGEGVSAQNRSLTLGDAYGVYGLLFEVPAGATVPCPLTVTVSAGEKDQAEIRAIAIQPAADPQKQAWKAAADSFVLLGYFGSDPQRPAPGRAAVPLPATMAPADLAKWRIREAVVFADPDYDAHWVEQPAEVARFFSRRGLAAKTVPEMVTWLKERLAAGDAPGTSALLATGVVPTALVAKPFADCLLAQYVKAGGRVVWMANVPMYVAQGETGSCIMYGDGPRDEMLHLTYDRRTYYGAPGNAVLAPAGKAWGLEPGLGLARPVHTQSVTVPFIVDASGAYCGAGLVNLNPQYPLSGFIFVPDALKPTAEATLRNGYRLALYSGKPVEVPVAGAVAAAVDFPADVELRFGRDDQRMCYLREEPVELFLRLKSATVEAVPVTAELRFAEGVAVHWRGPVAGTAGRDSADIAAGVLKLDRLRVGRYRVEVNVQAGGKARLLTRELRICPPPDHRGLHVAVGCGFSPSQRRTEELLQQLAQMQVMPFMFGPGEDKLPGHDLALWYGMSFGVRRHGQPAVRPAHPAGYDDFRRGSGGQIMRVQAEGDKREARGFACPLCRGAEAQDFGRQIAIDSRFPAFRQRALTGDDYSQWFGLDYNRYTVEAFQAKTGSAPPAPPGSEDPTGTINVAQPPGLVPDGEPWLRLNRFWSQSVLGAMGQELSRSASQASRGRCRVGPIPGGMMIPVLNMWSAQYAPFNFGITGFSLSSFYYYNCYWQPPLAHLWWLECARMGNRDQEQWIMPDCGESRCPHVSYYRNNGWLMLAGGAKGLAYFQYDAMNDAGAAGLTWLGGLAQRYGLLLAELRPVQKQIAMLVPFENVTYRIEKGYEMAYPYMALLQAQADVEPVSPEEVTAVNLKSYPAVMLADVTWLRQGTADLLTAYARSGGKVLMDAATAKVIPIPGAITLDANLSNLSLADYANRQETAGLRTALEAQLTPVASCDTPGVVIRRCEAASTSYLWVIDTHSQKEFQDVRKNRLDAAAESRLGYGAQPLSVHLSVASDARLAFDVFGGRELPATRNGGRLEVTLELPKWEGMLIALVRDLPGEPLLNLPESVHRGHELSLACIARDRQGLPFSGLLPLELKVTGPDGQEDREYARRLLARNGRVAHALTFADNDPLGIWTLEVTETLTGLRALGRIKLVE